MSTSPATEGQRTQLAIVFAHHGVDGRHRAERLALCTDHTGRPITSMRDLTEDEADTLLHRLHRLPRDADLLAAAHRLPPANDSNRTLTPAEVADRLGGVILCGGPPTEHDAQAVEAFARQLDQRARA